MTISNALARCAEALGDAVSEESLILWLSQIENTVITEIAATHLCGEYDASPVTLDCDRSRELFVPDPYSELYVLFAVMKNDLRLRDIQKYMNSAAVFSAAYANFADMFNRTNAPQGNTKIVL